MKGMGKKVSSPKIFEPHYDHYLTHIKQTSHDSFKRKPMWIQGSYQPGGQYFGQGLLGHILTHVMHMVTEVKLEMKIGVTFKLERYATLPGWILFAQYFWNEGKLPGEQDKMPTASGAAPGELPPEMQGVLSPPPSSGPMDPGAGPNMAPIGMPSQPNSPPILPQPGGTPGGQATIMDLLRQSGR